MVSRSQANLHANFSQVYYDKRLKEILWFLVEHRGTTTKEISSLGIALICKRLLEKLENETSNPQLRRKIKSYKMKSTLMTLEYLSLVQPPNTNTPEDPSKCPIAECVEK